MKTLATLRLFRVDTSGHFAVIFSLLLVPLIAAGGLALDYANVTRIRTELQNAADSAALAAAKDADITDAQREKIARSYFEVNASSYTVRDFKVSTVGQTVKVDMKSRIDTSLMRIVGQPHVDVDISATAAQKASTLEIVFALDVSGSMLATMSSGKTRLQELKDATSKLIDRLAAETDYDVRAGYVPFTMNVNIGTANSGLVQGETQALFAASAWKGCVFERVAPNHVKDSPGGRWHAYVWPPMPDQVGSGDGGLNPSDGTNTGYKTVDEASQPATDAQVLLSGPNYNCTRNVLKPLDTDLDAVKAGINALQASGNMGTLVAPGVTWGMRLLSPAAPFTEGKPYSNDARKILFVVTDGDQVTEAEFHGDGVFNQSSNSSSPWTWDPSDHGLGGSAITSGFGPMDNLSPYGFIRDSRPFGGTAGDWNEHMDQLVKLSDAACTEVKSGTGGRNIAIFTMGVSNATGPGSRAYDALRNCASNPKNHFYVDDTAAMDAAFTEILERMKKLRLTN